MGSNNLLAERKKRAQAVHITSNEGITLRTGADATRPYRATSTAVPCMPIGFGKSLPMLSHTTPRPFCLSVRRVSSAWSSLARCLPRVPRARGDRFFTRVVCLRSGGTPARRRRHGRRLHDVAGLSLNISTKESFFTFSTRLNAILLHSARCRQRGTTCIHSKD